jgi:hypothetical protein
MESYDGVSNMLCYGRYLFSGARDCSSNVAFFNGAMICDKSGGTFQTDGSCSCPPETSMSEFGCVIRNSQKCDLAGAELWDGTCKCDPGYRGAQCESASAEKEEAQSFVPFYVASGAVSVVIFGVTLYFSHSNLLLALFATLRVWDTMSDWAMWSITLQNDRFVKFSTMGSDEDAGGDDTFKKMQIAALVFTIVGTILLIVDLGTLRGRFSSDKHVASNSGIGYGMCSIVIFEDIPQLVITLLYLVSVDGFEGIDSKDSVAIASLTLSVISLLLNGGLGCVIVCREL